MQNTFRLRYAGKGGETFGYVSAEDTGGHGTDSPRAFMTIRGLTIRIITLTNIRPRAENWIDNSRLFEPSGKQGRDYCFLFGFPSIAARGCTQIGFPIHTLDSTHYL